LFVFLTAIFRRHLSREHHTYRQVKNAVRTGGLFMQIFARMENTAELSSFIYLRTMPSATVGAGLLIFAVQQLS
jgi:hypothetical protein